MKLSPEDLAQLDGAMRLAFKPSELKRVLKFRLGRNFEDVTLATNYVDVTFDLLDASCREGWIEELIVALREERMGNAACRSKQTHFVRLARPRLLY
jgi:hypothetical protein